jgi:CheY-like chemotaxis protein
MSRSQRTAPLKILLVEDNDPLRDLQTEALAGAGYAVQAAAAGDEALLMLEQGLKPDLVLTDVRMPGRTNGVDLANWVSSNRPGVKVLLQTGYTDTDTGAYPVLRKPFTVDDLLGVLTTHIGTAED